MNRPIDEDRRLPKASKVLTSYAIDIAIVIVVVCLIFWVTDGPSIYWSRWFPGVFKAARKSETQIEQERHNRAVEVELQRIGNQLYQSNQWREREYYDRPFDYRRPYER